MSYSEYDESERPETRWDDFRAFVAIAQSSSIKKASLDLGTTQGALSKRLVRLESALGVRLLDRGPQGASLTYQGERVLTRVLAAEKELSRATADALAADSRVEGDCSILAPDGIANCWLSKFLAAYFDRHPDVELRMVLDHAIGMVRNQVFDIRLHYCEPIDPTQTMRPIAWVHFVPFASRGYLEKHGTPRSVADLAHHRILDQTQHPIDKGSWAAWFDDTPMKRTAIFTNQSAFLAKCVHEGVGIAFMPTYMALADDSIVPLALDSATIKAKLYVSYHRERAAKAPVETTLRFLRTVVFDAPRMPWFDEELRRPDESWRALYAAAVERAQARREQ